VRFSILAIRGFLRDLGSTSGEERLVARRNVVKRPVRGKSAKTNARFSSKCCGRQSGLLAKLQAERSQAFVSKIKTNIGHALVLCEQEAFGFVDSNACQKLVRGLAECQTEQSVEMKRREACMTGGHFECHAFAVAIADVVSRTKQTRKRRRVTESTVALRCELRSPLWISHRDKISISVARGRSFLGCGGWVGG
jgi:hypothetical protein